MTLTSQVVDAFARRRGLCGIVAVLVTLLALAALSRLKIDDDFNNLLRQSEATGGARLDVEADDNACLLLVEGNDILDPESQAALRDVVVALDEVDGVEAVHSIFDARKPVRFGRYFLPLLSGLPQTPQQQAELREQVLKHPMIRQKLLTADGKATLVVVELSGDLQGASQFLPVLDEIWRLAEGRLSSSPLRSSPLSAGLTGIPALQTEMTEAIKWEQIWFISGSEVVGILLSWLIFRRWAAVFIVQAAPITAVVWSMGCMALFGEPLNVINSVLAPLVMVIALTDSVHLLFRIRGLIERGSDRQAAVWSGLKQVGPACFLTSVTTCVAFASLGTASIEVLQRFGWTCAVAVVVAFLAVVTVVPIFASTALGDHIARPAVPSKRGVSLDTIANRWIGKWRIGLAVFSLLATIGLGTVSTRLKPDIQMQQFLPTYGPAMQALVRCDALFNGSLPVYVEVEWGEQTQPADLLEALESVERILEQEPNLGSPFSIATVLQSLSPTPDVPVRSLSDLRYLPSDKVDRLLQVKQHRAVVVSRIRDQGTRLAMPVYAEVREQLSELKKRWPDLSFRLTGWTVNAGKLSGRMLSDMMTSLYVAVLVSLLILAIAFRSLKLGLISLIPNLFPLVATSATMVALNLPLHFSSATVFSICFGVAVDDTIHFIASYQQQGKRTGDATLAVEHTLRHVGQALVASTLIMLFAFAVVVFSRVPSISEFATVFMIVLGWALVGDLLFLPAWLRCFPTVFSKNAA